MPRVLVSVREVAEAVQALAQVDVGGEVHVDAADLAAAVGTLTGLPPLQVGDTVEVRASGAIEMRDFKVDINPSDPEQARLDALPPGSCQCAGRFAQYPNDPRSDPARHVHPGTDCEACATTDSAPCTANEYVDTTVRSVAQARLDSGVMGVANAPGIVELPHTEPEVNPARRPPPGVWRPASGTTGGGDDDD